MQCKYVGSPFDHRTKLEKREVNIGPAVKIVRPGFNYLGVLDQKIDELEHPSLHHLGKERL